MDDASEDARGHTSSDVLVGVVAPIMFDRMPHRSPLRSFRTLAVEGALVDADELSTFIHCGFHICLKFADPLQLLLDGSEVRRAQADLRELQGDSSAFVEVSELLGFDFHSEANR